MAILLLAIKEEDIHDSKHIYPTAQPIMSITDCNVKSETLHLTPKAYDAALTHFRALALLHHRSGVPRGRILAEFSHRPQELTTAQLPRTSGQDIRNLCSAFGREGGFSPCQRLLFHVDCTKFSLHVSESAIRQICYNCTLKMHGCIMIECYNKVKLSINNVEQVGSSTWHDPELNMVRNNQGIRKKRGVKHYDL
jgi:hypothetical protein